MPHPVDTKPCIAPFGIMSVFDPAHAWKVSEGITAAQWRASSTKSYRNQALNTEKNRTAGEKLAQKARNKRLGVTLPNVHFGGKTL